MSKVDEWVANREDRSAVRPCVDLACGVEVWVGDNGAMRIGDCSETIGIDRADIPAFVDDAVVEGIVAVHGSQKVRGRGDSTDASK